MSEATAAPTAEADEKPLFTREEIAQFEADDAQAGQAIGRMLATIFLYTALVMSFAAWWTYSSIAAADAENEAGTTAAE